MRKVVVLATFLAATYAPSAFATAELKLTTGASTVDILDGGLGDACLSADCVTFVGALGSWTINVTTGTEGLLFLDLNSVNQVAGGQTDPITLAFSDDATPPPQLPVSFVFEAGGTVASNQVPTVTFNAYTDIVKFGTTNQIGSTMTFHTSPFSGTTTGAAAPGDLATTIVVTIDLGKGAKGQASFDTGLATTNVPEPASISMLGGVLLILGGALRRRMKKA
jgi:hypothetical protein